MSYVYTFIGGGKEIEVNGFNLLDAAKNAGLFIYRADKQSNHYLQSTPFNKRERNVWCVEESGQTDLYLVKQRRVNY